MSQFHTYKNINIHYSDSGKGQSVVLLHGFLENLNMWKALSKELLTKYRVICIDLLGHGKTECLGYIHTMEMMAEAVKSVLNHLKIDRFFLIGHSMGGYVALAYSNKYEKNIIGLCLVNSTSQSDSEERKINRDRAIDAVKQNHKTYVRISISNLFRTKNRKLFLKEIKQLVTEALEMPVQGIIAALEGMKIRFNQEKVLQSKHFKTMMIIGRKDPVLNYVAMIKELKNTNVLGVELADGHMSYIENQKDFTYNIMHFIEKF